MASTGWSLGTGLRRRGKTLHVIHENRKAGDNGLTSSSFALLGTTVIKVDPERPDASALSKAAEVIRRGGLVAFPTETVYGLGADGLSNDAVSRIFAAKGRPATNPLILHVTGLEQVEELSLAEGIPEAAYQLAGRFWPGPLTLVMRRTAKVPDLVAANRPTFSCRAPAHAVALALIRAVGRPLAAPSANLSGRPSPVTAKHVLDDLSGRLDLVLDAGQTPLGIESTVLDLTVDPPRILRQGAVTREELEAVIGPVELVGARAGDGTGATTTTDPAPGASLEHYRPRVPVYLIERTAHELDRSDQTGVRIARVAKALADAAGAPQPAKIGLLVTTETAQNLDLGTSPGAVEVLTMGSMADAREIAANLYSRLRDLEQRGVTVIAVESVNSEGIGAVIMDRLRQAAGHRVSD